MPRLAPRLLIWYSHNARRLPWRGQSDPYAVWISEVMLQQTRVETVVPYYQRWIRRFPNVTSLARASEQEVLRLWEGLGYYGRARNLRRAAKLVVDEYGGQVPQNVKALRKLPGIGRYTAAAIASIAFGLDEAVLDGNIRRVLARVYDVTAPVDAPEGERFLWKLAAKNLPVGKAGDYNQALMDLGAAICLPRQPHCARCPLTQICRARRNGTQAERPVRRPRKPIPTHVHAAGVIYRRGRVLLARRPSKALLGGLWEFPNGRVPGGPARGLATALRGGYNLHIRRARSLGILEHAYTHFRVTVHAFRCELVGRPQATSLKWVRLKDLGEYPMGKIDRQIASMLQSEHSAPPEGTGRGR